MEYVEAISGVAASATGVPQKRVVIEDCGEVLGDAQAVPSPKPVAQPVNDKKDEATVPFPSRGISFGVAAPPAAAPAPVAGGFSFAPTSPASTSSGFSFAKPAAPSPAGAPAPASSGFNFAPSASAPSGGFSFAPASAPSSGFSFGGVSVAPSATASVAASTGGGFSFKPAAAPAGGGFSFAGGGSDAPPLAFGAANAGLFKKEEISLQSAADAEPIVTSLKSMAVSKLILMGAPVDCDETPTVSDEAAKALGAALKGCAPSLKTVKLGSHRFESSEAMEALLGVLGECKQLEELDLTNTSLGEEGGAVIQSIIKACPALHTLRCEDCELGEDGCLAIAKGVADMAKLRELDLRWNDMEADSAASLAKSLSGKTAVTAIKLDEDLEEGAEPVREALQSMGKADALMLGDDDDDEGDDANAEDLENIDD
jgi:hypothetical protein